MKRLENQRINFKMTGATLLGMGLATAVAGSFVVGFTGLCGLEEGVCNQPSTLATFDSGYAMISLGAASAIGGIVLLALSHNRRVELERLRALIPSVAAARSGATAGWTLRF
jgi:hypothetical protein